MVRGLVRILLGLGVLQAVVVLGFIAYTRLPSPAAARPLDLAPDTRYAVIFFHGVGGQNEPVLHSIEARFRELLADVPNTAVVYYQWDPWSDSRLRSGAHGIELAQQLGAELAGYPQLEYVRMVIHSAGARFPDPLCESYRALAKDPAHLEATFIDGMSIRGFLDVDYGYRNFGSCLDYAAAIFTNDGEVPGTNEPLDHAWNVDVTAAPGRATSGLDSHHWPLGWFLEHLDLREALPGMRSHAEWPRGAVSYPGLTLDPAIGSAMSPVSGSAD